MRWKLTGPDSVNLFGLQELILLTSCNATQSSAAQQWPCASLASVSVRAQGYDSREGRVCGEQLTVWHILRSREEAYYTAWRRSLIRDAKDEAREASEAWASWKEATEQRVTSRCFRVIPSASFCRRMNTCCESAVPARLSAPAE